MEATTLIEKLIEIYQNYNETNLDINHLESHNICENCRQLEKVSCVRNKCLEHLLANTKYPCKYLASGCSCIEQNITEHEKHCEKNMKCSECTIAFASRDKLMLHLTDNHDMANVQIDKPMVNITVGNAIPERTKDKAKLYNIQAADNSVVLRLIPKSDSFHLLFCNATDLEVDWSVTVVVTAEDCEYRKKGRVCTSLKHLSMPDSDHYMKLNIRNVPALALKIYFADYENIEPFIASMTSILKELECPICLDTMENTFYQCLNGHNVCVNCKPKIRTCPLCRLAISSTNIRVNNVFANVWRPCPNAHLGCFVYSQGEQAKNHQKTCLWKRLDCLLCQTRLNQATIGAHMIAEHNVQMCIGYWTLVVPGHVSFNGSIFKFDFQIDNTEKVFKWYLCSLGHVNTVQYNMKVHLDDGVVQARCISQHNETYSLMNCSKFFCDPAKDKPNYTCMILPFDVNGSTINHFPTEIHQDASGHDDNKLPNETKTNVNIDNSQVRQNNVNLVENVTFSWADDYNDVDNGFDVENYENDYNEVDDDDYTDDSDVGAEDNNAEMGYDDDNYGPEDDNGDVDDDEDDYGPEDNNGEMGVEYDYDVDGGNELIEDDIHSGGEDENEEIGIEDDYYDVGDNGFEDDNYEDDDGAELEDAALVENTFVDQYDDAVNQDDGGGDNELDMEYDEYDSMNDDDDYENCANDADAW